MRSSSCFSSSSSSSSSSFLILLLLLIMISRPVFPGLPVIWSTIVFLWPAIWPVRQNLPVRVRYRALKNHQSWITEWTPPEKAAEDPPKKIDTKHLFVKHLLVVWSWLVDVMYATSATKSWVRYQALNSSEQWMLWGPGIWSTFGFQKLMSRRGSRRKRRGGRRRRTAMWWRRK